MYVVNARNVNSAFQQGTDLLRRVGVRENSRAGEVIASPSPVTTVYSNPRERVLFSERRGANPFFHLMESVWMLAGARDARWLDRFVHDFSSRFAEDDGNAHGAYGYRWRRHWPLSGGGYLDQITEAGRLLRENPRSRQVVIAMWDPTVDLGAVKKDVPCNDMLMFRGHEDGRLDMTIVARSNDAVWGAYGANAVHMSVLMEVVAGLAGMLVGKMYQISNNFHYYLNVEKKLPDVGAAVVDPYASSVVRPEYICFGQMESEDILLDAERLIAGRTSSFHTQWFNRTIAPMWAAFEAYKGGDVLGAVQIAEEVAASDWNFAARNWLKRRMK